MNEKREKEAFPRGEKSKNAENRLSQHWENKKSAKNDFPNIGKNKKCHWLHFPTLGKTKNPESLLSDFRGSVHFDTSSCFSHKPLQNRVHLNDLKHTPFELISTFPVEKAKSDLTQVIRFI